MSFQNTVTFRKITEPVDLCLSDGRLNPDAVGYSTIPLHSTSLTGWGRNKRWEYWGIIGPELVLGLTISSLDYAGVHQQYFYHRPTGRELEVGALVPFARGVMLPDHPAPITAVSTVGPIKQAFVDGSDHTNISSVSKRIQADLRIGSAGESLSVVVPWSEKRFQYTVKDLVRPVTGRVTVDGRVFELGEGYYAVLDRGRGVWPYSMTWNWAAGNGVVNGKPFGLQLGGKWTDGTVATENALMVDGTLHYLDQDLSWDYDASSKTSAMSPWRIHSDQVDATFTPFTVRTATTQALVVAGRTVQGFGEWSGWATDNDGIKHDLAGLIGWAEEARNRW